MLSSWDPWSSIVMCTPYRAIISRGVWVGDNPFFFASPVLMLQIGLSSISTATFDFLLRPLGLCSFFSQMLGAIFIGPWGILRFKALTEWVFSHYSLYIFETLATFGSMFFLFLVGLKMDVDMVVKSGRRGLTIGFFVFLIPLLTSLPLGYIMRKVYSTKDPAKATAYPVVAFITSETSFHVIVCLLADLKLLNTEMGRLAMSSSVISNSLNAMLALLTKTAYECVMTRSLNLLTLRIGSVITLILIVVYGLRPIMLWMIRRTPEGRDVRQVYVFSIFLMVLLTAFIGQATGQPITLGPVVLGLVVPVGPPLGSTIEHKLEAIVQHILVPLFYVASAARLTHGGSPSNFYIVETITLLAFVGKLVATVLSSLYCNVSFEDALALGLVMVSQGLYDVINFRRNLVGGMIDLEVYSILTVTSMVIAAVTSALVKYMYRPSKRYMTFKRSIQHTIPTEEFRILACTYHESNAPTILDILQASNPTVTSPVHLYLLHLIELQRVTVPILIAHKRNDYTSVHYNRSKNIINAFRSYETHSQGTFSLSAFTAMSPYATMHDDICTLAVDKKTSLIILPFHRQLIDGLYETTYPIRNVNQTVLRMSPCTVGILVDQGQTRTKLSTNEANYFYHVAIVFLGGADDREVLSYGMRMAEYPCTTLTVIRFRTTEDRSVIATHEMELDADVINEFRLKFGADTSVEYIEEVVENGIGMVKVFKSMDHSYDLIMVGRQHERDSPLVQGLTEWNEFPELGFVGDMLATLDSNNPFSLLVIQQQFSRDLLRSPSSVFIL